MKSNNPMGNVRNGRWALGAAVLLCVGLAQAQGLEVTNAVYQVVQVEAADGTTTTSRVPAARVVPGTEVVYEIEFRNAGTEAASDVAIDNPVPPALVFIGVDGALPAAFSVDGGERFGPLETLTVIDEEGQPRQAEAADVTNLRWFLETLAPGEGGKVAFRARVR